MGRGRRRMCAPLHAQEVPISNDPRERLSRQIELLEERVKALRGRLEEMGDPQ